VLGERIPYVLLPGPATQDEAAEDPLAAAKAGLQGDLELYWKNKLLRPLSELLKPCLPAAQVQARRVFLFLQKQWCHDKHSGLQVQRLPCLAPRSHFCLRGRCCEGTSCPGVCHSGKSKGKWSCAWRRS